MMASYNGPYIEPYLILLNGEDPVKAFQKYEDFIKEIGGSDVDVIHFGDCYDSWKENADKETGHAGVIFIKCNDGSFVEMHPVKLTYWHGTEFSHQLRMNCVTWIRNRTSPKYEQI